MGEAAPKILLAVAAVMVPVTVLTVPLQESTSEFPSPPLPLPAAPSCSRGKGPVTDAMRWVTPGDQTVS